MSRLSRLLLISTALCFSLGTTSAFAMDTDPNGAPLKHPMLSPGRIFEGRDGGKATNPVYTTNADKLHEQGITGRFRDGRRLTVAVIDRYFYPQYTMDLEKKGCLHPAAFSDHLVFFSSDTEYERSEKYYNLLKDLGDSHLLHLVDGAPCDDSDKKLLQEIKNLTESENRLEITKDEWVLNCFRVANDIKSLQFKNAIQSICKKLQTHIHRKKHHDKYSNTFLPKFYNRNTFGSAHGSGVMDAIRLIAPGSQILPFDLELIENEVETTPEEVGSPLLAKTLPQGITLLKRTSPMAAAIMKAVHHQVDAINISSGFKLDENIIAAFREAKQHGIPIIMSAGNGDNYGVKGSSPEDIPDTYHGREFITNPKHGLAKLLGGEGIRFAGALEHEEDGTEKVAGYSQYPSHDTEGLFLFAAGSHLPVRASLDPTKLEEGTSFASPTVAGAYLLLKEFALKNHLALSSEEILDIMYKSGRLVPFQKKEGYSDIYRSIDLERAQKMMVAYLDAHSRELETSVDKGKLQAWKSACDLVTLEEAIWTEACNVVKETEAALSEAKASAESAQKDVEETKNWIIATEQHATTEEMAKITAESHRIGLIADQLEQDRKKIERMSTDLQDALQKSKDTQKNLQEAEANATQAQSTLETLHRNSPAEIARMKPQVLIMQATVAIKEAAWQEACKEAFNQGGKYHSYFSEDYGKINQAERKASAYRNEKRSSQDIQTAEQELATTREEANRAEIAWKEGQHQADLKKAELDESKASLEKISRGKANLNITNAELDTIKAELAAKIPTLEAAVKTEMNSNELSLQSLNAMKAELNSALQKAAHAEDELSIARTNFAATEEEMLRSKATLTEEREKATQLELTLERMRTDAARIQAESTDAHAQADLTSQRLAAAHQQAKVKYDQLLADGPSASPQERRDAAKQNAELLRERATRKEAEVKELRQRLKAMEVECRTLCKEAEAAEDIYIAELEESAHSAP